MKRRHVLYTIGGASLAIGGMPLVSMISCQQSKVDKGLFLKSTDIHLLDQIADAILPTTPDSPGAMAAGVGMMLDKLMADCISLEHREIMVSGIESFKSQCLELYGKDFQKLNKEERLLYLTTLDKDPETPIALESHKPGYFSLLKKWTIFSYFTSEVGMTQALRYVAIPGKQLGVYPLGQGDKAWAL